jgi:2-hydroxy-6-oxo-6-(2'-aminophenyl)hexa-2,4-dienoate hydrolase
MKADAFDPNMTGYQSRFVTAGKIRTHYIEAGSGEPVVLVHGGGPGADGYGNWFSCLPMFAEDFRAIAVDMLGFGKTEKPDPESFTYSQDARTDHMIAFIEALGAKPVSLVGNSMGGITSLGVAMKRPELVRKLVLMGPAGLKPAGIPAALKPLMGYDGTAEGMRAVIRALTNADYQMDTRLMEYRVKVSNDPVTRKAQAATMGWVKEQHGLYFEEDLIRKVKTPTLLIGGKNDPIVPPSDIFKFLELLENSWGYLIPHCGHWVMMERPQEFSAQCKQFIGR